MLENLETIKKLLKNYVLALDNYSTHVKCKIVTILLHYNTTQPVLMVQSEINK